MGANMYDQPAQAQFINTYAPINFGELYRIGAAQKEEMNRAADQFSAQLQKFGEFKSPSAIDTENYYNNTINRQDFQEAINQMISNPDAMKDASFRSNLQSLINSVDYASLSKLKQSRDAMLQRQQIDQKLMLENKYNPLWHGVDYDNYDTLNNKIFDDITPLPYMSVRELVEPYVNNLKGEFLGSKNGFLWNGVTDEMTDSQLQENISSIQNTPQYQKYLEMYQKQGLSKEQAQQQLATEVFNAGREFTWNKADRDPMAVESMRLQAKYARQAATANNMHNLTKVLEMDTARNHLLKFTNLTPEQIDAFSVQGYDALTPEQKEEVMRAQDPRFVDGVIKDTYNNVLRQTRRYLTAENAVIDELSSPVSYEVTQKYAANGTTGKQDKDGFYIANNTSSFKLASEYVQNLVGGLEDQKGLQRFIGLWNDGTTFSNFKVSSDQRKISDGRDIYLVKYAYVPESELLRVKVAKSSLKALGAEVVVNDGTKVTKKYSGSTTEDSNLDNTTVTGSTPTKMIRLTVLQKLPRQGEPAITADATWMDKNLGVQGKTQDAQDWQSQNENI